MGQVTYSLSRRNYVNVRMFENTVEIGNGLEFQAPDKSVAIGHHSFARTRKTRPG